MKQFKPMLSATLEDPAALKFPVLVSPKLDGIRCIIRGGVAVSRNLKPIPNAYVQRCLKGLPDGLDGELIVGKPVASTNATKEVAVDGGFIAQRVDDVFNRSTAVMKATGEPDFTYWVFDYLQVKAGVFGKIVAFKDRIAEAEKIIEDAQASDNPPPVKIVPHMSVDDEHALAGAEDGAVKSGYEGVMIRDPNGKYKFGRSTVKEGGLLKWKRWLDAEAVVVDMVERQHNGNEATKDELGRTKRSSAKANKTGRGDMGTLVCEFTPTADQAIAQAVHNRFELGTGFTDEERAAIWQHKDKHIGALVTFKYQALTPDGVPRFPVFKGFRHPGDVSA